MFRQRDPQDSLFGTSHLVPPDKAKRLRASWAEGFRAHALPLIDEAVFAPLYCPDTGRPNRPVQTVFGVLLLKEMHGLTDAEALEQLEFNLQWHHALGLTPEEAHLPQKTLHNFRARVMAHDGGRVAFETMTDRILQALGTKVSRQRLDSTHVISHIAVLTRLGLFCETVRLFLRALKAEHPRLYGRVPKPLLGRYVKADGTATAYDDARAREGPRRLAVCARDVYRLWDLLAGTAAEALASYALLQRLLQEQCTVGKKRKKPRRGDDDAGERRVPVGLKAPDEVSSASLQSPHDPDATYNARKGKGYEVQIAETCHPDNRVEVITHVEVTEACAGDGPATVPILQGLVERGQLPQELVADTAYGSAENAVDAERLGTELVSPVSGPAVAVEAEDPERPLTSADFHVDVRGEDPAVCPAGHFSTGQTPHATHPYRLTLTFDRPTCEACPWLPRCPAKHKATSHGSVVSVNLAAANLERRRRAEAGGHFRHATASAGAGRKAARASPEASSRPFGHGVAPIVALQPVSASVCA